MSAVEHTSENPVCLAHFALNKNTHVLVCSLLCDNFINHLEIVESWVTGCSVSNYVTDVLCGVSLPFHWAFCGMSHHRLTSFSALFSAGPVSLNSLVYAVEPVHRLPVILLPLPRNQPRPQSEQQQQPECTTQQHGPVSQEKEPGAVNTPDISQVDSGHVDAGHVDQSHVDAEVSQGSEGTERSHESMDVDTGQEEGPNTDTAHSAIVSGLTDNGETAIQGADGALSQDAEMSELWAAPSAEGSSASVHTTPSQNSQNTPVSSATMEEETQSEGTQNLPEERSAPVSDETVTVVETDTADLESDARISAGSQQETIKTSEDQSGDRDASCQSQSEDDKMDVDSSSREKAADTEPDTQDNEAKVEVDKASDDVVNTTADSEMNEDEEEEGKAELKGEKEKKKKKKRAKEKDEDGNEADVSEDDTVSYHSDDLIINEETGVTSCVRRFLGNASDLHDASRSKE